MWLLQRWIIHKQLFLSIVFDTFTIFVFRFCSSDLFIYSMSFALSGLTRVVDCWLKILFPQGEAGAPGAKGELGAKGEAVSWSLSQLTLSCTHLHKYPSWFLMSSLYVCAHSPGCSRNSGTPRTFRWGGQERIKRRARCCRSSWSPRRACMHFNIFYQHHTENHNMYK